MLLLTLAVLLAWGSSLCGKKQHPRLTEPARNMVCFYLAALAREQWVPWRGLPQIPIYNPNTCGP